MDKTTISHDRISDNRYQIHRLIKAPDVFLDSLGLQIVHFSSLLRGGPVTRSLPRHFEFYCISHLIEGHGFYWNANSNAVLEFDPGQAIFVSPGTTQIYGGCQDIFVEDTVCFTGCLPDALRQAGIFADGVFSLGQTRMLKPIIDAAMDPSPEQQFRAAILLQELILNVHKERRELSDSNSPVITGLLLEIRRAPEKWWTVGEMAEICQLSESHFRRVFQEHTGLAPKTYIDRFKIQKAAEMLSSSNLTLQKIADRLGYVDPFHFSRRFKAVNGVSPTEYRKNLPGRH